MSQSNFIAPLLFGSLVKSAPTHFCAKGTGIAFLSYIKKHLAYLCFLDYMIQLTTQSSSVNHVIGVYPSDTSETGRFLFHIS